MGLWRPHSFCLETFTLFKELVRFDALIHWTKLKNKSQGRSQKEELIIIEWPEPA